MLPTEDFLMITDVVRVVRGFMPNGKVIPSFSVRPSDMLGYVEYGEATYKYSDGNIVTARKGDILYIPKGGRYTYDVNSEKFGYTYADFYLTYPDGLEGSGHSYCCGKLSASVENQFTRLYEVWTSKGVGYKQNAVSILYSVLAYAAQAGNTGYVSPTYKETAHKCAEYIQDNYERQSFSLSDIESICGCSSVHVRRVFKECYGMSPQDYLAMLRIDNAKTLLRETCLSVEDVGRISGFGDASYFSRFFTKKAGCSPIKYRNTIKKMARWKLKPIERKFRYD